MTNNADGELRQQIDAINLKYMHNTGWNGYIEAEVYQAAMDDIMELVKNHELALLSRIKEQGPKDLESLPSDSEWIRTTANFHNAASRKWRKVIDTIAKEISNSKGTLEGISDDTQ